MANILTNPLLAQYLSGLGADLMKYGGNTSEGLQLSNVNAITKENSKARASAKLMKHFLDPSNNSNLKIDKKGITFSLASPNESATSAETATQTEGSKLEQPAQTETAKVPNPFSLSPSDVAGASSPELIEMAKLKMTQDKLNQETVSSITDSLYKKALIKQAEAAAIENTPSVQIQYGDKTMLVTPKDAIAWEKIKKETTPNEVKLYEYAQKQGFKGSIVDFKDSGMTDHMKEFKKVKDEGYKGDFNTWLIAQKKAGATNISLETKLAEKKAMSELSGQLYFNDPKWTEDIHKQVAEFDKGLAWNLPEKDRPLARSKTIVKAIEDKIVGGGGTIQGVAMDKDNKTMIWTVKWPSGDTKTIKQAVR